MKHVTLEIRYHDLMNEILQAIREQVNGRTLNFNGGIVVGRSDEDPVECIVAVHSDLTVSTDYNGDVEEKGSEVGDYPLHIQLAVLRELEQNHYAVEEQS